MSDMSLSLRASFRTIGSAVGPELKRVLGLVGTNPALHLELLDVKRTLLQTSLGNVAFGPALAYRLSSTSTQRHRGWHKPP